MGNVNLLLLLQSQLIISLWLKSWEARIQRKIVLPLKKIIYIHIYILCDKSTQNCLLCACVQLSLIWNVHLIIFLPLVQHYFVGTLVVIFSVLSLWHPSLFHWLLGDDRCQEEPLADRWYIIFLLLSLCSQWSLNLFH